MHIETLFLINPSSGKKNNPDKTANIIQQVYERNGLPVKIQDIDFGRLDEILAEAVAQGVKNIYAVGGDGTVNAIGSRLINLPVNFGVIPNGSGNGFGRNAGFSINTKVALDQSVKAWRMKVDTATFNDTPFINVAGVGLDAVVAEIFSHQKKRGFRRYVKSSAEGLMNYKPESYTITIDGALYERDNVMGVVIANGTQWGYDAKISPQASLTDGLLDVIIVKHFPLLHTGGLVGRLFNGKIYNSRHVEVLQGKKISIDREHAGTAQVDGEPFHAGTHIDIQIHEQSLNLLVPDTLTYKRIKSL